MNKTRLLVAGLALLAAAVLTGCEQDQSAVANSRLASQPLWDAAANPFVAPGWTSGDKASWIAELNRRAQYQNEYARIR